MDQRTELAALRIAANKLLQACEVVPKGSLSAEFVRETFKESLPEAATALQSSGGEVSSGEFGAFYVCPKCTGAGVVTEEHASPAQPSGFVLVPVERGLDERVNDDSFRALVHGFRSQIGARRPSDSDPEDQWAWDKATDLLALLLTAAPAPIEQEG